MSRSTAAAQKRKESICDMNIKKDEPTIGRRWHTTLLSNQPFSIWWNFLPYKNVGSNDEDKKIIFHTKNEILAIATIFGRWTSAKMIDNGVELRSTKKKCCNGDTIKSAHFHFNQYFSCSSSSWNDIATFSTTTTEKTFLFVSPSQWWHCSLDFSSTTSVGIRNTMEIGCSKEIHNRLSASRISFNQHENEE